MSKKLQEIAEELKLVLAKKSFLDLFITPIIFLILNIMFGLKTAILTALVISFVVSIYRIIKKQKVVFTLLGFVGVLILAIFTVSGSQQKLFFAPNILVGFIVSIACLISLVIKKPIVALTSHITRRWPWKWYLHPQVKPSYDEVTIIWFIFFLGKTFIQIQVFNNSSLTSLNLVSFVLGWPFTVILLVFSYLYGIWRLKKLQGPSVDEYLRNKKPPWKGQTKGF